MSDDDEQPVMVEKTPQRDEEETDAPPEALQIVSIGTEDDAFAFTFHEDQLNAILSRIPAGWKVSIVSVVGAFRTGKSFLLSWFLRYLHQLQENNESSEAAGRKWYEEFQSLGNDGFDWRGGAERNTSGIWMWSHPSFIQRESGDPLAVLLVDTQGMFDHDTTMALTASIFGLSTLLSSYQIYNVDKRIQEDNLQHLALFSEYARMAMSTHDKEKTDSSSTDDEEKSASSSTKPFQHIEYLVRDWQNFEEEEDFEAMEKEMEDYLQTVIADKDAHDLQETREQILNCFEKVSCYGMSHPGMAVTKKKYTGDVSAMDEIFLHLLDRYCSRVFDDKTLSPKVIHGRELTAVELGSYVKAYARLFASGAHFPEAATLLEATSSANNTNAVYMAMNHYKEHMDHIAGPHCSNYVRPDELKELNEETFTAAIEVFDSIASFGNQRSIDEAKERLMAQVAESWEVYETLNDGRNPLKGLEMYLVPMFIAFVSFILRWVADTTCSDWSQVCRASSDVLSHVYAVGFCFVAIVAATKAKQISELLGRIKAATDVIVNNPAQGRKSD